jgi:hypothetical protein
MPGCIVKNRPVTVKDRVVEALALFFKLTFAVQRV